MTTYSLHITLYDVAFLAAIFTGLTFSLLLWFTKNINFIANRFLAIAVLIIVLWMAWVLGNSIGLDVYVPHWSRLPFRFSLALGPFIYFYVLKITQPGYKLRLTDLLHFIPLLLQQCILAWGIGDNISVATYYTPIFRQLGLILNMAAFISVLTYLYISFRLIESYYQQLKFNNVNDRYRNQMRWLSRLIRAFGLLWLLWLPYTATDYFYFHYQLGMQAYYPLYLLLAGMMIWIAATAHSKPGSSVMVQASPVFKTPVSAELRQKGAWLRKVIEANRYYEDAELNLTSLAEKLGLTVHELSRIINVALKKNFNDFINEYRVAEVICKMLDPAFAHITLLGIALESGFNSKSSFNRIFKQLTGKSPAEYKNEPQKEFPSYNLRRHAQFARVISKHETTTKWSSPKLNRSYMFKNYFKIAWRNITRHQSYSAINVAGLAVGIAACLLIFVVVQYELSFDTYQPGYKSTYRIVTKKEREGNIRYSAGISTPAVDAFRLYYPQAVVAGINAIYGSQIVAQANGSPAGDKKFVENTGIMFAEPQLFDIFSATWLAGSASALRDPDMVVIDKSSAIKYFGNWQ
ncbi:helix-turn-helix domain-containing protein [Mucilaginibacter gossypiicola]|uniref:helix-turn-helix domain-containing protein n=1 Tax=Mucilaginibacter gossypiicola TaxID=551995 RepID=UPI000B2906EF|nr:helix-turn-helix domain-containing protein [Mucilaginibacter gossypiicola]